MRKNAFDALVALDSIMDTMVFGKPLGLVGEKATDDELKEILGTFFGVEDNDEVEEYSIIGKRYEVRDNSYARCKTHDCEVGGLHGRVYTIVSETYKASVHLWEDEYKDVVMVDVKSDDTGLVYSVLFEENWIIADNGKSYWENAD